MQSKENINNRKSNNYKMDNRIKDLLNRIKLSEQPPSAKLMKIEEELRIDLGSNLKEIAETDKLLKEEIDEKENLPEFQEMKKFRSNLPSYKMRHQILDIINKNQTVLISGETGCGKTTQISQFILDEAIENNKGSLTKILCTQPRRISAISVAKRIAAERCEELGKSVGYQIRLEKVMCREYGSILFCTGGILLQNLRGDIGLGEYSHIILDEIHERTIDSDLIITLLKEIIHHKPELKIILMSATMDADKFSKFFNNCPVINITGLTYPVREYYLEDIIAMINFKFSESQLESSAKTVKKNLKQREEEFRAMKEFKKFIDPVILKISTENAYPEFVIDQLRLFDSEKLSFSLIINLIKYICNEKGAGTILIFVPGFMDISNLISQLKKSDFFHRDKYEFYPVHSTLSSADQQAIFNTSLPEIRKIIVATSIAETSITINDVKFVIDTGKIKTSRYDLLRKIDCLETEWITLANGIQRRGRAGRVEIGECYKLYTRAREATFLDYPTPEILRSSLDQVILQLKMMQFGPINEFFKKLIESPSSESIEMSLNMMKLLNAIDNDENLTPLGFHLARLPVDPKIGKMMLLSTIFSCVDPIFSIAACLSYKVAFMQVIDKKDAIKDSKMKLAADYSSDHIAFAEASRIFESFQDETHAKKFCDENFLNFTTLTQIRDMKQEFVHTLYDMKFIISNVYNDPRLNQNSKNFEIVKAVICAGLYPNIAEAKSFCRKFLQFRTLENEDVRIHPNSVNFNLSMNGSYSTFFAKQKSSHIFLHDSTIITPMSIIFAAPNQFEPISDMHAKVKINSFISLNCKLSTIKTFQALHIAMNKLLEIKLIDPLKTVEWEQQNGHLLKNTINILTNPSLYY